MCLFTRTEFLYYHDIVLRYLNVIIYRGKVVGNSVQLRQFIYVFLLGIYC